MINRLLPDATNFPAARFSALLIGSCLIYEAINLAYERVGLVAQAADQGRAGGVGQAAARPLDFVENRGQWDAAVRFFARKGMMAASFERDQFKLHVGKDQRTALGFSFEGASGQATLTGEDRRSGYYNFFN